MFSRHSQLGLVLALAVAGAGLSAHAAPITWSGASSATWSTPANWGGTAPTTTDTAVFSNASPTNQPTLTAIATVDGLTLTVNPTLTLNADLTVTNATGTTGSAGITLKGASNLVFNATGTNLNFGTGTITLDGGGLKAGTSEIVINTTTGMPTGGGGTDRTLLNNISVTANGGRLSMNAGSGANGSAIAFNTLTLGGALTTGSNGGGNSDGYTIAGTVTLLQDVTRTLRFTNNTGHNGNDWIAGQITDGAGSANNALRFAVTGRTLQIANSTNNYAGGTIVESGLATMYLDVMSAGTLGTGNLTVQSGGRVRLNNATALGTGGNLAAAATITADAGSVVGIGSNANNASRFTATSAGVYGIDVATHSYALDMSTLGNGRMFLGTLTGGTYSGTSLTAGLDSTYRLGGGSASTNRTNLTLSGTNALTGTNTVLVGDGTTNTLSFGRVQIGASQNVVGKVTINTNGFLVTTANGGTPFGNTANTIEVFGTLAAAGLNGVFNSAYASQIALRPGSSLMLDNENFSNGAAVNSNRWDDSTALPTLNGASVVFTAGRNVASTETVGGITFNGNSAINMAASTNAGPGLAQLTIGSLTRSNNGVLLLSAQGTLGTTGNGNTRLIQTSAPTPVNGMVTPWLIRSTGDFLNYTTEYVPVTYSANTINTALSTDVINTASTTLSTNPTVYALKATSALIAFGSFNTITIGSGSTAAGLSFTGNNVSHSVIFDTQAREAIVWVTGGTNTITGGLKTSGGLTKAGASQLTLTPGTTANQSISGGVIIQGGTIALGNAGSASDMSDNLFTVNHAGTFNLNNFDVTVAGLAGVGLGGNVTNSGANAKTLTLDFSGTQTYEGRLQGSGTAANLNLIKTGAGTQILGTSSVSSYTGTTAVSNGTLLVNGTMVAAANAVTVGNGAILGGSGTINRGVTIQNGGHVAPGNSPGILTTGNFTMDANGIYDWQYDGSVAGQKYDQIKLNTGSSLTFNGAWTINLINLNATGIDTSAKYYIFTGIDASALSLGTPTINPGSSGWTGAILGKDAAGVYLTNVPEPTSLSLLGLGAAGLLLRRRRQA